MSKYLQTSAPLPKEEPAKKKPAVKKTAASKKARKKPEEKQMIKTPTFKGGGFLYYNVDG